MTLEITRQLRSRRRQLPEHSTKSRKVQGKPKKAPRKLPVTPKVTQTTMEEDENREAEDNLTSLPDATALRAGREESSLSYITIRSELSEASEMLTASMHIGSTVSGSGTTGEPTRLPVLHPGYNLFFSFYQLMREERKEEQAAADRRHKAELAAMEKRSQETLTALMKQLSLKQDKKQAERLQADKEMLQQEKALQEVNLKLTEKLAAEHKKERDEEIKRQDDLRKQQEAKREAEAKAMLEAEAKKEQLRAI